MTSSACRHTSNIMGCRTLLLVSLGLFLLPYGAEAESESALTCSVTQMSNGSFKYQLSEPITSPSCETYWVDHDNVVIARDSSFNENLTMLLNDQFIILKTCSDHLHYTRECNEKYEGVDCRVNCSFLLNLWSPKTVNFTLTCFSKEWCPSILYVILCVMGVIALVVGVFIVGWFIYMWRRRRRGHGSVEETGVSYTPATQVNIKTEIVLWTDTDVVRRED